MNERLPDKLNVMAKYLEYWLDWNTEQYRKEGMDVSPDTHIRSAPVYPTYDQIYNWIDVMKKASKEIETSNESYASGFAPGRGVGD